MNCAWWTSPLRARRQRRRPSSVALFRRLRPLRRSWRSWLSWHSWRSSPTCRRHLCPAILLVEFLAFGFGLLAPQLHHWLQRFKNARLLDAGKDHSPAALARILRIPTGRHALVQAAVLKLRLEFCDVRRVDHSPARFKWFLRRGGRISRSDASCAFGPEQRKCFVFSEQAGVNAPVAVSRHKTHVLDICFITYW